MPHTLAEIFSRVVGRPTHRHHCRDPYVPAQRIHDLSFRKIAITPYFGALTVKVTGSFTQPITRKSGAPLAIPDIDHFSLHRNGVEIQVLAPNAAGAQVNFTDTDPLTGADTYEVFTVTKDGFISDASNDAVVTIAAADPAVAITDLTATPSP